MMTAAPLPPLPPDLCSGACATLHAAATARGTLGSEPGLSQCADCGRVMCAHAAHVWAHAERCLACWLRCFEAAQGGTPTSLSRLDPYEAFTHFRGQPLARVLADLPTSMFRNGTRYIPTARRTR